MTAEIKVRVVPRASRSEIVGLHDDAWKVRLMSPPVDGAANEELIRLLSKILGVAKTDIDLLSGQTSKTKRLRIGGLTQARADALLKAKSAA